MSELHELCLLKAPISENTYLSLLSLLKEGIPATYTLEESEEYIASSEQHQHEQANKIQEQLEQKDIISEVENPTTTPLHILFYSIPDNLDSTQSKILYRMVEKLFEYGAGWNHVDSKGNTPGCVLIERGLQGSELYGLVVDAGVRAELVFRKVEDVEFLDYEGDIFEDIPELVEEYEAIEDEDVTSKTEQEEQEEEEEENKEDREKIELIKDELSKDASNSQSAYLESRLTYKEDALVTDQQDGVMMSWETKIMKLACDTLFSSRSNVTDEYTVLNIGFGMGIIDRFIQERKPTKHYICEAHPDVLKKMDEDGWFDKENVVILPGKWQEQLPEFLNKGVVFNAIYYDTFSEHYSDMLELFDAVVGLLDMEGVFSFFNGLGADRTVVYDVYKKLVEIDLNSFGLQVDFKPVPVEDELIKGVFKGVKRSYWKCPIYYHPEIRFM